MIWVAWRQFRTQALVTLGLLAAFTVLVLVTGLQLRDVYSSLGGAQCSPREACTAPALTGLVRPLTGVLGPALLAIPALLGMFWGAPLVARELESGTHRLAWTQSVTRRRWLSVKVALVGVSALAVAGLASWLVSWWFAPLDAVDMNRFAVFDERGIVAVGYAGFAFALGIAAGAVARRTLPAMAATLLGFVAVRIAFTFWVRPHLLAPRHVLFQLTDGRSLGIGGSASGITPVAGGPPLPNAWTLSAALVDRARHAPTTAQLHDLLVRYCPTIAAGLQQNPGPGPPKVPGAPVVGALLSCGRALSHRLELLVTYQPASRYWPLQALETGIFLAAALALIGATIWRLGRRAERGPAAGELRARTANPNALDLAPQIRGTTARLPQDGERSTGHVRQRTSAKRRRRRI